MSGHFIWNSENKALTISCEVTMSMCLYVSYDNLCCCFTSDVKITLKGWYGWHDNVTCHGHIKNMDIWLFSNDTKPLDNGHVIQ